MPQDFQVKLNPDYAVPNYCGLKNLVPPLAGLLFNIFITTPSAQNRLKFAFRWGSLTLATMSAA